MLVLLQLVQINSFYRQKMDIKTNLHQYLFYSILFVGSHCGSPLVTECSYAFNLKSIDLARILPLQEDTHVTINNAYTSQIVVKSPCCQNITLVSEGTICSFCAENGIKICNFTDKTIEIKHIEDEDCKSKSQLSYSCTSQICSPRNNTEFIEIYRPGDDTGCFGEGQKYVCSKFGNWTEIPCKLYNETTTSTYIDTTTESVLSTDPTTSTAGVTTDRSATEYNHSATVYIFDNTTASSILTPTVSRNSSQLPATQDVLNMTDINIFNATGSILNGLDTKNETVSNSIDTKQAMKALYTFLIVLGAVLVLVFILVCVFFIRKQKDKISLSHVNYPLEYWHDKEYIDTIVEKSFTPKSTYTLNPMYDNKGYVQRYKKKDESDFKKRKHIINKDGDHVGNEKPRRAHAFRTKSNDSVIGQGKADHPRRTTHNYTDKYIATAVGSNFYNYSPSQSQDVVKKTTDLDASLEDEVDQSCDLGDQSGTSSFKPRGSGRKQERDVAGCSSNPWDENYPDDAEDIYGVNYKEHLRRSLEDWSAEESDA